MSVVVRIINYQLLKHSSKQHCLINQNNYQTPLQRSLAQKNQLIIMRAKVYYGKEIHIIDLQKVFTLQDLKYTVRRSFKAVLPPQISFMAAHADTLDDKILREIMKKEKCVINLFIIGVEDSILKSVKSDPSFECLENESGQEQSRLKMKEKSVNDIDKDYKIAERQDYKCRDEEQLEMLMGKEQIQTHSSLAPSQINDKQVVNEDIQCDGCHAFPIKGPIFKCLVCQDFDLCASCEQTQHHHHPFLKVARAYQYPIRTEVQFSRESKNEMIDLQKLQKSVMDQRTEANKMVQRRNKKCEVIPLQQLKVRKVCEKNFLSEILGSSC